MWRLRSWAGLSLLQRDATYASAVKHCMQSHAASCASKIRLVPWPAYKSKLRRTKSECSRRHGGAAADVLPQAQPHGRRPPGAAAGWVRRLHSTLSSGLVCGATRQAAAARMPAVHHYSVHCGAVVHVSATLHKTLWYGSQNPVGVSNVLAVSSPRRCCFCHRADEPIHLCKPQTFEATFYSVNMCRQGAVAGWRRGAAAAD